MRKILAYLILLLLVFTPVKARVDIKKVPFHGTEEEWKRIQRDREKDNTALLFIVIIGGIVGVGLLISRQ